jgi:hypothetical protein
MKPWIDPRARYWPFYEYGRRPEDQVQPPRFLGPAVERAGERLRRRFRPVIKRMILGGPFHA